MDIKDYIKSITSNNPLAELKWKERVKRIRWDNIFMFIEERDGIKKQDFEKLSALPFRGVVAFTCNDYPDIPYCVYLKKYHKDGQVGNILKKHFIDDSREYEQYFDFVQWFNTASGNDFNVGEYIKKMIVLVPNDIF